MLPFRVTVDFPAHKIANKSNQRIYSPSVELKLACLRGIAGPISQIMPNSVCVYEILCTLTTPGRCLIGRTSCGASARTAASNFSRMRPEVFRRGLRFIPAGMAIRDPRLPLFRSREQAAGRVPLQRPARRFAGQPVNLRKSFRRVRKCPEHPPETQ